MSERNDTRGSRRALKTAFAGGALLVLGIGCSTTVDGVDEGELLTSQHALPNDICIMYPEDPSCEDFGDPAPTPTTPGGAVINTTYWRIEHAGWQLSTANPVPANPGSNTLTANDTITANYYMKRTSSATTSGRAFGMAIVRAIPRPITGGTITTACSTNADCWKSGVPHTITTTSDQDGPLGAFNYCIKVGTSGTKTCVQRPGAPEAWQQKTSPTDTAYTTNVPRAFTAPIVAGGAPYGTVTTVGGSDKYSTMAALNVVGQIKYGTKADGSDDMRPPCSVWDKGPAGSTLSYEEDPAYCVKMVRPWVTLTKWRCGDGTCNGTETHSTCASDCHCGDGVCGSGESYSNCAADCCNLSQTYCVRFGLDDPECQACYF